MAFAQYGGIGKSSGAASFFGRDFLGSFEGGEQTAYIIDMALFLEVLSGSDSGKRFHITAGMKIGRGNGDIKLEDKRVSTEHAKIEWDKFNIDLILVDLGSANGTFVDEKRVSRVLLMPGVTFRLGDTRLKVVQGEVDISLDPVQNWQAILKKYLSPRLLRITAQPNSSVKAFKVPLLLKIIEGVQADTEWYLGWGPRCFGKTTLEFRMHELGAPDVAFEIYPNEYGDPVFSTAYPKAVLVNEQPYESGFLEFSDLIRVGNTLIKVLPALGDGTKYE